MTLDFCEIIATMSSVSVQSILDQSTKVPRFVLDERKISSEHSQHGNADSRRDVVQSIQAVVVQIPDGNQT